MIGQHDVDREVGGVLAQHLQVLLRGEAIGLPRLRRQVQRDQPPGGGGVQRLGELGHLQVRQHAGEPRPRAEHDPVGAPHRLDRLRAGGRVGGHQGDRLDVARRDRAGHLPPDDGHRAVELHLGLDVDRHRRHRQHPAVRPEQAAHPVEPGHGVVEQLPQRHDQEVADGVPV